MIICLYIKLNNTVDMSGIIHSFCKYIKSWFCKKLNDMAIVRNFLMARNQMFL